MLCLMHQGAPYGHLRLEGADGKHFIPDAAHLARMTGNKPSEIRRWLAELEAKGVAKRDEKGRKNEEKGRKNEEKVAVFSKKMVRDEAQRESWKRQKRRQRRSRDHRNANDTNVDERDVTRDIGRDTRRDVPPLSSPSPSPSPSPTLEKGSFGELSESAPPGPVHWDSAIQNVVIDEDWLRDEIEDYQHEAGVELTRREYEHEAEQLRLKLLADPRLRACIRKANGKPSSESQFKRLATFTAGWFKSAIRMKAERANRPARASPNSAPARRERTDEALRQVMRETLDEEKT